MSSLARDAGRPTASIAFLRVASAFLPTGALLALEDRLYRQLAGVFRADLPVTRLLPWGDVTFVHRRVRGLSPPYRTSVATYMEELWVDREVAR